VRIDFLHQNIYGVGGTVRSVINLANALAGRHTVSITSVFRRVDQPGLAIDERVTVRGLVDMRTNGADRGDIRLNSRSALVPPAEEYFRQYSELTDERIANHLSISRADVIVGTRPSLNLLVAEFGPERAVLVAQEHMTHHAIPGTVRARMKETYGRLQLVTTVTEADRARVIESLGLPTKCVVVVPNSVPAARIAPSRRDSGLIFAVGRLAPEKRYDVLLRAVARALGDDSAWRVRIFGDGPQRQALETLAEQLEIRHLVDFMGSTSDMESAWPSASIMVSTSERESFGMSIVEALRNGVPVVSTDCPDGPREILTDGSDGYLVPVDDVDSVADRLRILMRDAALRDRLGDAGLVSSERFDPVRVASRFESRLVAINGRLRWRGWSAWSSPAKRRSPIRPVDIASMAPDRLVITNGPRGMFWKNAAGERRVVDADPGGATATFDTAALGSGIWNLHAPVDANRSRKVRPLHIDTRVIAAARPRDVTHDRFDWAIPYRTFDGYAGLKVWNQQRHAELLDVRVLDDEITLECAQVGLWATQEKWALSLRHTGIRNRLATVAVSEDGHFARFRVPFVALRQIQLMRDERWVSIVHPIGAPAEGAVVAAVMSDIPDLRRKRGFPQALLEDPWSDELFREHPARVPMIQPIFEPNNVLAFRLFERA
jgi:glycosyltransferase involved in cell wall biosynthesis